MSWQKTTRTRNSDISGFLQVRKLEVNKLFKYDKKPNKKYSSYITIALLIALNCLAISAKKKNQIVTLEYKVKLNCGLGGLWHLEMIV